MTGGACGTMLQFQLAPETSKDAGDRRYPVRAYNHGYDNIVAGVISPDWVPACTCETLVSALLQGRTPHLSCLNRRLNHPST